VNARGDAYARKPEDILNSGYLITIIHKNSGKLSTATRKASAPYVYVPRHLIVKSCSQYMEAGYNADKHVLQSSSIQSERNASSWAPPKNT
jgi:hypothetical protein